MKPTERAKQALAYKLVDYLCDDPENNMATIMGKIDVLAPASLFAEQRAAFSDAIKNKTNMYQLIMRVMDLNPEVRADLLKTLHRGRELPRLGQAGEDARAPSVQHPLGHPAGSDERLQPPLHRLLGRRVRTRAEPRLRRDRLHHPPGQGARRACVHLHRRRAARAQARPHSAVRGASGLRVSVLHERHAHRRGVLPGDDPREELRPRHLRRGRRGGHRRTPRRGHVRQGRTRPWTCSRATGCPSACPCCYTHDNARLRGLRRVLRLADRQRARCSPGTSPTCPWARCAPTELMPTPDAARTASTTSIARVRAREAASSRIDFQNDGEFVGGCIAGGRRYLHINAAGDVEPCVFIHYSNANIREQHAAGVP